MLGSIEVFQGYEDKKEELIFFEDNMIVDGAKEHIVDVLTHYPSPSALSADVSSSYDASTHNIKAFSIAPPRGEFSKQNSLYGLSGYVIDYTGNVNTPSAVYTPLIATDNYYLCNKPSGYDFSITNVPGKYYYNTGTSSEEILKNSDFSKLKNYLLDPQFYNYRLDDSLSGADINNVLGLYELDNWGTKSTLRYFVSSAEFDDQYIHPSISVSSAESTPAASSFPSGINLLYIRSFVPDAIFSTSGVASIAQSFVIPSSDFSNHVYDDKFLQPVGFIEFGYYVLESNTGTNMTVFLLDTTTNEFYDFESHSWEPNLDLYFHTSTMGMLEYDSFSSGYSEKSYMFNITKERLNDKFKVVFAFNSKYSSGDEGNILKVLLGNPSVGVLEGWKYGKVSDGDNVYRTSGGGIEIFKDPVGPPDDSWDTQTAIIQPFSGLVPNKGYHTFIDAERVSYDCVLKTSLISTNNFLNAKTTDEALQPGLSSLNKYSSDNSVDSMYNLLVRNKVLSRSEKCVEISPSSVLSGSGEFFIGKNYKFGTSYWGDYPPEYSKCAGDFKYGVGSTQITAKITHYKLPTLYWDWDSQKWKTEECYLSLDNPFKDTGFIKKIDNIVISSDLKKYTNNKSKVNVDFLFENTEQYSSYFKDFELLGTSPSFENTKFSMFGDGNNPSGLWVPVSSNYAFDDNLSSLSSNEYVITAPDNTEIYFPEAWKCIEGLEFDSTVLHREESETKFILRCTSANASGKVRVNSVGIGDAATVFVPEKTFNDDVITSEKLESSWYFGEDDSFMVRFDGQTKKSRRTLITPKQPYGASSFPSNVALGGEVNSVYHSSPPNKVSLEYSHYLSSLCINKGDNIRLMFDYHILRDTSAFNTANSTVDYYVMANIEDKGIYIYNWDDECWDTYPGTFFDDTSENKYRNKAVLARSGFDPNTSGMLKTVPLQTVRFNLGYMPPDTKIKWGIRHTPTLNHVEDPFCFTNIRFFKKIQDSGNSFPEFPNPVDKYVQNPLDCIYNSKFGHYPNYLAEGVMSSLSGLSDEEIRVYGAYPPASGMEVSGIIYSGVLNKYGVINSDGYILENRGVPSTSSVYGFTKTFDSSSVEYELTLSSSDYNFLTDIGRGIGALGLWSYDFPKTASKLKGLGYSLSSILDTSAVPLPSSVYNITDIDRNPKYRLFAKKVFNNGGLLMDPSSSYLRIKWKVKF